MKITDVIKGVMFFQKEKKVTKTPIRGYVTKLEMDFDKNMNAFYKVFILDDGVETRWTCFGASGIRGIKAGDYVKGEGQFLSNAKKRLIKLKKVRK